MTAPRDALRVNAATRTRFCLLRQQGYRLDIVLVTLMVRIVMSCLDLVTLGAYPRVAHAALALTIEEATAAVLFATATRMRLWWWQRMRRS